jgi:hypothetical protein
VIHAQPLVQLVHNPNFPKARWGCALVVLMLFFLAFPGIKWFSFAFCEYVHNEFIYIHINSRLYYLRCKLIYLINSK